MYLNYIMTYDKKNVYIFYLLITIIEYQAVTYKNIT